MKTIIALTLALTLPGCSGTIGALCYIPADSTGQCTAAIIKDVPPTTTKSAEAAKI